jgi:hypothetical protein
MFKTHFALPATRQNSVYISGILCVMTLLSTPMNDAQIRKALKQKLAFQYKGDHQTVIVEELGILNGASRIDLAVVNGVLHGFELKSDRDTLTRLSEQARVYGAVFDWVTLVVGERHVRRAAEFIPDWWGIRVARRSAHGLTFCDLKLPLFNPSPDPFSVVSLLWRDEALDFLEEIDGATGMRSKSKTDIFSRLVARVDFNCLRERVRRCLRGRLNWRSAGTRLSCGD